MFENNIIPPTDGNPTESPVETSDKEKKTLALLPLKQVVILPKSIRPIIVGRQSSIKAVEYALKGDRSIFVTSQKDPNVEAPTEGDIFWCGTRAVILQTMRMPNGSLKILAEGICRSKAIHIESPDGFMSVEYEDMPTIIPQKLTELEGSWRLLQSLYTSYAKLNSKAPAELGTNPTKTVAEIDYAVDTMSVHVNLSFTERQVLLEATDLGDRILKLSTYLHREIDILETEERIRGQVQTQVEKNQREYYLNEQMKAIQKELGRDGNQSEIDQLYDKVSKLALTPEAKDKVDNELRRLEQMPPMSSEAVVSRHYIDWISALPWNKESKDSIGLEEAEKILDLHHAGLKKAKERIVEFIAAKKFSKNMERSPIICLVGPPGVGKTSLAKSISDSLGRDFVRISLGGIRDEAEIRGHRRTYIGALPGKIIQAMKKATTQNPVILLDEIDKLSHDFHGDPASALLEVLDPEQNRSFVDHFLDVEYNLSKVMFITTANHLDGIPLPLFDRMETISLSGYTTKEKIEIAKNFLIPKNLKEYGLKARQCKFTDNVLDTIVTYYTKESGVRQLERTITKIMRKNIQALLKTPTLKSLTVTESRLKQWLGNHKFKKTSLGDNKDRYGVATGLAWTEVGGDMLEIETAVVSGKGNLSITGQIGEVMQESAQAALSYIRCRATDLGIKSSFHSTKDIHIHMPEGATPKDGPSAGITICVALVSALTKNPTAPFVTMTGEITLQGRILGIGGLKEKLLAAQQHGFKTVLIPKENEDDFEDLEPGTVQGDIEIKFVSNMDEVLEAAFVTSPFEAKKAKRKAAAKKKITKKTPMTRTKKSK